jgi:anaerobic selenocysteine-containing dehydrogenase
MTSPLIRREGTFVPVGWEEALAFAAKRLARLKEQHGPQSLAVYHGEGIGHQEIKYFMKRFANVYGTPNFMGVGSICNAARTLGEAITYGEVTKPDISDSQFLMVWGGNPLVSHEPFIPREISRLKKRGGCLVVVDPRRTETAAKADVHLPVRPGRDEILVLNMLHVILREALWDQTFTKAWVHGFQPFYEVVIEDRFSPEAGEGLTGIPAAWVRRVARAYAAARPACVAMGNGLEHHRVGIHAIRLLAIMKALTGNIDVAGGDLFTPRPKLRDITTPRPPSSVPPIGSEEFPLFCHMRKEARALSLPQAILEERPYAIKGMIEAGGNVTLEWPGSSRTRDALDKLEFLMVIDVVWSPDCQHAHVVLPACTFLERDEHRVNVYLNLPHITLRRQVVEPVSGLPDQVIWMRLAKHMGFGEYFPWQSCREGIDVLLDQLGISYEDLLAQGGIYPYYKRAYKTYESGGFHTPTGKVEIFSERLKRFGYDPFPIRADVLHPDDKSGNEPLRLTTGGNLLSYLHWQYRYIPRLRKMAPEPLLEIHPEAAQEHGIAEGDMAEVQTATGSIQLKAHVTSRIRPDTVHIPHGWEEANVNELTDPKDADPISGFPNLKSVPCRVRRI